MTLGGQGRRDCPATWPTSRSRIRSGDPLTLPPGTRLGPYEIVARLGAGAMGEVYRARDSRLSRDVAVKVLPEDVAANPDRLARFEREARAISALSHPNIVSVHDIGREGTVSYMALELVEGQTLRAILKSGPLPFRQVLAVASQIAEGLAAAHGVGIVHRDLKPENLMVTKEGRVKILDFGLAKNLPALPVPGSEDTLSVPPTGTADGTLLGTIGYMSPEQASGRHVDARSDIFAFGSILYEIWTGHAAFAHGSPAEILTAVIRDDPELPAANNAAEDFLRHILGRCLAKAPDARYAASADLASDLKHVEELSSKARTDSVSRRRRSAAPAWVFLVLLAIGAAVFAGSRVPRSPGPSYRQLTFRRGTIWSARFAQDGNTIVYSAAWDGEPFRLFRVRPENPESVSMNFPDAEILAVSKAGEMLVGVGARAIAPGGVTLGLLAQAPLEGGTPRELLQNVTFADWAPNGTDFAVIRSSAGRSTLEFPLGTKLYETAGFASHPRVSPDGKLVAFLDHPSQNNDEGEVCVVDRKGRKQILSSGWASVEGLAWSRRADEIWFAATTAREGRALHAVTTSGRARLVGNIAGSLTLQDIAPDGRVLLVQENRRLGAFGKSEGDAAEKDLSWFDSSLVTDVSEDGRQVLFTEFGGAVDSLYAGFLRSIDGRRTVRLGPGYARALSPDGRSVLAILRDMPPKLALLPTGAGGGTSRMIPVGNLVVQGADWFPDGRRFVVAGNEPEKGMRLWACDISGGPFRPLTPEGMPLSHYQGFPVSPNGLSLAAVAPDSRLSIYPTAGGDGKPVPELRGGEVPIRWMDDVHLLAYVLSAVPAQIVRIDVSTGAQEPWRTLAPADAAGIHGFPAVQVSRNGRTYAYSYARFLSDLYLAEGFK